MAERRRRLVPLTCPVCEFRARASMPALRRAGLPTCGCGARLIPANVEDAARLGDDVLRQHPDAQDSFDRWVRETLRQVTRPNVRQMRCGGCRRWLRAANEACSCGFHNDIRGNRNRGGYPAPF